MSRDLQVNNYTSPIFLCHVNLYRRLHIYPVNYISFLIVSRPPWIVALEPLVLKAFDLAQQISKKSDVNVKSDALHIMGTVISRGSTALFNEHSDTFFKSRVVKHLREPKKVQHSLQLVLKMLRGPYAECYPASISSATRKHTSPLSYVTRAGEPLDKTVERLQLINNELFGRKSVVWTEDFDPIPICVDIVMQMAATNLSFVVRNVFPELLKQKPSKSHEMCVIGIRVLKKLLDPDLKFATVAWAG
jgi:hypothetical protein